METKRCGRCGQEKPLSEYRLNKKRGKVSYQSFCNECVREYQREQYAKRKQEGGEAYERERQYYREWYQAHKGERAEYYKEYARAQKEQRVCRWCGKPLELGTQRWYCSDDCRIAARRAIWHKHNRARYVKRDRRRAKPHSPDEPKQCMTCGEVKTYADFPKHRNACKACIKGYKEAWLSTKSEKYLQEFSRRRRLRLRGVGGHHSLAQWKELKRRYDYTCLACGRREPEIELTRDHIVPLLNGGTDDIENIQPLCRSCNSSKSAKAVDYRQYVVWGGGV